MIDFLILLGPPGSGKGTQASLMKEKMNYVLLSTGDLLRDEMNKKSAFGIQASDYINKGLLVPDEMVTGFILDYIKKNDLYNKKVLFDGFPRRISQAESLAEAMKSDGKELGAVLLIALERDEIIRRLSGRKMCPQCKSVHHPDAGDKCPRCGIELIKRTDDNEETIIRRIEVYEKETAPLIDYYEQSGLLRSVDGKGSIDEVYSRIEKVVKNNG